MLEKDTASSFLSSTSSYALSLAAASSRGSIIRSNFGLALIFVEFIFPIIGLLFLG
jgi:hypothetical protein